MRRAIFCFIVLLPISAFGQSNSSDSATLQALLSEVRGLRQELRVSLNQTQNMQILLVRFQMQEGVVTRDSDRLSEARQRLSDFHLHQRELSVELKRLEEEVDASVNNEQQLALQDRIKHVKSDLDLAGQIAQQQQTAEIQAEQQLRAEQDKLTALENQLDELIRAAGPSDKPTANHP